MVAAAVEYVPVNCALPCGVVEVKHVKVRKVDKSHENPRQGGEAFRPIKTIVSWLLPNKFLLLVVAEPGGCS